MIWLSIFGCYTTHCTHTNQATVKCVLPDIKYRNLILLGNYLNKSIGKEMQQLEKQNSFRLDAGYKSLIKELSCSLISFKTKIKSISSALIVIQGVPWQSDKLQTHPKTTCYCIFNNECLHICFKACEYWYNNTWTNCWAKKKKKYCSGRSLDRPLCAVY